jgi:hypothetical protein
MNKRQILLGTTAFLLALGGFVAGKANNTTKKGALGGLSYKTINGAGCVIINDSNAFQTQGSAGSSTAFFTASGGSLSESALYPNTTCFGTAGVTGNIVLVTK